MIYSFFSLFYLLWFASLHFRSPIIYSYFSFESYAVVQNHFNKCNLIGNISKMVDNRYFKL